MRLRGVGYRVFSVVRWIERSSFGAKTGRVLALGGEEEACKCLESYSRRLASHFQPISCVKNYSTAARLHQQHERRLKYWQRDDCYLRSAAR
jgi:hypothetical protein